MGMVKGIPALIAIVVAVVLGTVLDGGLRKVAWAIAALIAVVAAFAEFAY